MKEGKFDDRKRSKDIEPKLAVIEPRDQRLKFKKLLKSEEADSIPITDRENPKKANSD